MLGVFAGETILVDRFLDRLRRGNVVAVRASDNAVTFAPENFFLVPAEPEPERILRCAFPAVVNDFAVRIRGAWKRPRSRVADSRDVSARPIAAVARPFPVNEPAA